MRATVTIPADMFAAADRAARSLGISRSRLYQEALDRHLRALRERTLTGKLNRHIERHGQAVDASFKNYVARVWAQDMGDDAW